MRWRVKSALLAVNTWIRTISNKIPSHPEDHRNSPQEEKTTAYHGQEPAADMLRAEWAAFQTLIREIHRSEEEHQASERNIWAAQLRTAKSLNWVTAIGA